MTSAGRAEDGSRQTLPSSAVPCVGFGGGSDTATPPHLPELEGRSFRRFSCLRTEQPGEQPVLSKKWLPSVF